MRARASTRKINRERNVIASHFTAFSWKSYIWSEFLGLNSNNTGIGYRYIFILGKIPHYSQPTNLCPPVLLLLLKQLRLQHFELDGPAAGDLIGRVGLCEMIDLQVTTMGKKDPRLKSASRKRWSARRHVISDGKIGFVQP